MADLISPRFRSPAASRWPSILDRYLLSQLLPALALCLGTVLVALLLERLLRLFNILAQNNQALPAVMQLIADLVPHYLGLALPAAFFAAMFMVVARLGDDNELDAYLAGGQSIARLTLPFLGMALLLALFSAWLFGSLQPHARYEYRAVMYRALNAGWDARLQANTFANAGNGYTLTSDEVDASGRGLRDAFIRRMLGDDEEITVGASGSLEPVGNRLQLELQDGQHIRMRKDGSLVVVDFRALHSSTAFTPDAPAFRARGNSERELSFGELLAGGLPDQDPPIAKPKLLGEFHGRLARTLSLPLLPLLAIPLGLSAKRGKRTASLIVAAVTLLLFHHSLQLGQSLAQSGKASPWAAVWGVWLLFAGFSGWIFSQSLARPGDNPVTRAVAHIEAQIEALRSRLGRHRMARA